MEERPNKKKKTMGRRRVEIKRIEDNARRRITFTKRRDGLFKKTKELCNLSGVEAAIITFSVGGKAFAFGNPTVDSVVDRYLAETSSARGKRVREVEDRYAEALARLEAEKKRGEITDKALARVGGRHLLDAPVEALELEELEEVRATVEEMVRKVLDQLPVRPMNDSHM